MYSLAYLYPRDEYALKLAKALGFSVRIGPSDTLFCTFQIDFGVESDLIAFRELVDEHYK